MYLSVGQLTHLPIISLQTSDTVAWTERPVIDMSKLQIVGLYCHIPSQRPPVLLVARDFRQLAADCLIIDNEDDLVDPSDIIRLQDILNANYSPLQKAVFTTAGQRLGTVEDYNFEPDSLRLHQLLVRPSLLKSWLGSNLTISRSQIVDLTPQHITVRDTAIHQSAQSATHERKARLDPA